MESSVSKETKRRFFRKTGSIQKSSFDNSTPNQSPISSMGQSFENPYSIGMSHSLMNSPRSSMSVPSRPGTGNSISLDETEIKMSRHRHFTATPRRARSAERFDGMRIAFSTAPGDTQAICAQLREELLARNRGSPQTTRSLNNGVTVRQVHQLPGTVLKGMASPPPPYTAAVTEISGQGFGPPSYRQAVAAAASMTLPNNATAGQGMKKAGNTRYAMPNRGTQSFDTNLGMSRGTLRSAASVPAFTEDIICSCSKCQVLQRPNEGYNNGEYSNDAVYMESQAFLMHEIMTDGMAFCSIV